MRYRLRTLMIVLALAPPVLAGAWSVWGDSEWLLLSLAIIAACPLVFVVGSLLTKELERSS